MRKKKLIRNIIAAVCNQLAVLLCGIVLPRRMILCFGSEVNGLVSSITNFLGLIALMELGVGAVVQSALYQPLAEGNDARISAIFCSANRFFRKIAVALCVYAGVLAVVYPTLVRTEFGFGFTASLLLAIAGSMIAQYYFGVTCQLLLCADQKSYVPLSMQTVAILLNTAIGIALMDAGASIQQVKLFASVVLLLKPLLLMRYVRKTYRIDHKIRYTEEPIKQKWNGLAQHVSAFVLMNTDVMVLTLFSSLEAVSVYSVYALIVNGLKQMIQILTTGVQALFGSLLANKEWKTLNEAFCVFEWLMHLGVTVLYTVAGITIVPFVQVYTRGITDAAYIAPVFAWMLIFAHACYCLRKPYHILVSAAGHYKQTQSSAFLEAALNLVLSVVFVWKWGLVGVAVGTAVSMAYRTIYLAWYLQAHILHRSMKWFWKNVLVDTVCAGAIVCAGRWFALTSTTYAAWLVLAAQVSAVAGVTVLLIHLVFYRRTMCAAARLLFRAE